MMRRAMSVRFGNARWELDGTMPSLAAPPLPSHCYSLSMVHARASHPPAKFAIAKPGVKPAIPAMVPTIDVKNARRRTLHLLDTARTSNSATAA